MTEGFLRHFLDYQEPPPYRSSVSEEAWFLLASLVILVGVVLTIPGAFICELGESMGDLWDDR